MPAVGTVEQRRVIEADSCPECTAIGFWTSFQPKQTFFRSLSTPWLIPRFKRYGCGRGDAAKVANKCWKAGHRGDNEANHMFGDAVACGLISVGLESKTSKRVVELRTSARLRS